MKLLLCFALLCVASVNCNFLSRSDGDGWLQTIKEPDLNVFGIDFDFENDDEDDDKVDIDEDDDDEDEDEDEDEDDEDEDMPTRKPMQKHKCMTKFWSCKKKVGHYDCAGKLKCFEEKSKCYQLYKAKQPKRPPNKAKLVCKNTFNVCIKNARPDSCDDKLVCYTRKQRCYMRLKTPCRGWRCRHHHRRRPHHHKHHHRRPTPCPKMMKCKKEFMRCIFGARSCNESLSCMWKKYDCMKRAKPTEPPTTMEPQDDKMAPRQWKRKWDPKVMAKCTNKFEKCINASTTCTDQIECFIEKKICYMSHRWPRRRFPMPSLQAMKCKLKWKFCSMKAQNCSEQLSCMWRKHECMRHSMPTEPPTSNVNASETRRRWHPNVMAKCLKEFKTCINGSTTCQQKMGCFRGIKKCIMQHHKRPFVHISNFFKRVNLGKHLSYLSKMFAQKLKTYKQGFMNRMTKKVKKIKQRKPWKGGHWQNWENKMWQMKKKINQKIQMHKQKWQNRFNRGKDKFRGKYFGHLG